MSRVMHREAASADGRDRAIAAERREQALTCWSTAMDAISDARLGRPSLPLSPGDCPLLSSSEGPMRDALKEGECPDDPGPASRAMRRACGRSPRIIALL